MMTWCYVQGDVVCLLGLADVIASEWIRFTERQFHVTALHAKITEYHSHVVPSTKIHQINWKDTLREYVDVYCVIRLKNPFYG